MLYERAIVLDCPKRGIYRAFWGRQSRGQRIWYPSGCSSTALGALEQNGRRRPFAALRVDAEARASLHGPARVAYNGVGVTQRRSAVRPMNQRTIYLVRDAYRDRPALDTAVSRCLLRAVAQGTQPETLRLYRPGDIVAFGLQVTRLPRRRACGESGWLRGDSTAGRRTGRRVSPGDHRLRLDHSRP